MSWYILILNLVDMVFGDPSSIGSSEADDIKVISVRVVNPGETWDEEWDDEFLPLHLGRHVHHFVK